MKIIKNLILIAFLGTLFTSCSTKFYQVYQAKTLGNLEMADQQIVYEDEDCKISYNLWDDSGDIGFKFHNKTNQNIFVNLEESFFIVNGIANNYYKNRVYTNSNVRGSEVSAAAALSQGTTAGNIFGLLHKSQSVTGTSGNSIAYTEEKIIIIPPNTAKLIEEYSISSSLYRDCDLFRFPNKRQIKTVSFDRDNSPLVFSNRIAYTKGESIELRRIENDFYVNAITNYPEKEITESKNAEYCGERDNFPVIYFN